MTDPTPPAPEAGLDLDMAKLAIAIKAVIAHGRPDDPRHRPLQQAQVAREAGVDKAELSQLLVHHKPPSGREQVRLLRWLRLPAHLLALDPARATTPAAAA